MQREITKLDPAKVTADAMRTVAHYRFHHATHAVLEKTLAAKIGRVLDKRIATQVMDALRTLAEGEEYRAILRGAGIGIDDIRILYNSRPNGKDAAIEIWVQKNSALSMHFPYIDRDLTEQALARAMSGYYREAGNIADRIERKIPKIAPAVVAYNAMLDSMAALCATMAMDDTPGIFNTLHPFTEAFPFYDLK